MEHNNNGNNKPQVGQRPLQPSTQPHQPSLKQTRQNQNGKEEFSFATLVQTALKWAQANKTTITGLVMIIAGGLFILIARGIVLDLVIFSGGIALIYFGLRMLGIIRITEWGNQFLEVLKNRICKR